MKKQRCSWSESEEIYRQYHDNEWGVPLYDDKKLFEYLLLENFQAGLSWITILRKREHFRKAFDGFDYQKIAQYTPEKLSELEQNQGIIRNKLKIKAAVNNAQAFLRIQQEFGSFSSYIWGFVQGKPIHNHFASLEEIPARTELSDLISNDLKNRGFKFVGSTLIYAFMQAAGLVNDHVKGCFKYSE